MKLNRDIILKTAVTRFDSESGDYVTESPLLDEVLGAGDTAAESQQIFEEILDDYIEEVKSGRFKRVTAGRPPKGKTSFHAEVDPDIKKALASAAKEIGISQGEMVEYLYLHYQAHRPL